MVQMSNSLVESFFQAPRYAVFGTVSDRNFPQLSTVWYLYELGTIYVGIEKNSAKYRNLAKNSNVALCIDGEHPDGRTVTVYGSAEIIEPTELKHDLIVWSLIRRYHETDEDARRYQESMEGRDSVLLRVVIKRVVAMDYR